MPLSPIRRPSLFNHHVNFAGSRSVNTFQTRRAPMPVSASSWDEESRTFEAVISTGAEVQRRDKFGPFVERLDLSAIDPADLVGIAALDEHQRGSARHRIGTIIAANRDEESLLASIQLSSADDVAPIRQRVADGTLTHVSIGYAVQRWGEHRENGQRVRTAKQWEIVEVSMVGVAADDGARIRNNSNGVKKMPKAIETEDLETVEAMPEDQQNQIRSLAELAGLTRGWAEDRIDEGISLEDARAAAREAIQRRSRSTPRIRVTASHEDPQAIQTRAADALTYRMGGLAELPDASREYVSMSFLDMARDSLTRAGISTRGMASDEVFQRAAHGTSDFPIVVSNAANKTLLETYRAAESPLKTLARQRTLPNFKESTAIRMGGMGRLEQLSEHGEIKATSRGQSGEKLSLVTYARRFDLSRKLMIDDDTGAFGDIVAALGQAAAQTEAELLVSLLLDNPKMSDGTAIFHANRGNLAAAGAAPSETTLSEARLALRQRKDLDGKTLISATPKYLVVGPELETGAEKLLSTINAATTDDVNPFAGKISLLVEPRITGSEWFVFADPARLPGMQYAYLSGAQGPQIQRHEAWDTLGVSFRCFEDFGAGWVDWRAAQKNPGE